MAIHPPLSARTFQGPHSWIIFDLLHNLTNLYYFQVPERVLRTVRVAVTTKEALEEIRVKIGILVIGNQDSFEHIRCVRTRNYIFSPNDQIVNFDDLVDHDDLIMQKPRSCFLSGETRESFKILVTITPMSKYSSLSVI
jgi:hypothetical protein